MSECVLHRAPRKKSGASHRRRPPHTIYHETVLRDERRTTGPLTPILAKCPACGVMHTVMLAAREIEPGKVQRIYCDRHRLNRAFDGAIYSLAGNLRSLSPKRGAQA